MCKEASAVIEAPSSTEKYDVEGAQQSRMTAWGGFIVCSLCEHGAGSLKTEDITGTATYLGAEWKDDIKDGRELFLRNKEEFLVQHMVLVRGMEIKTEMRILSVKFATLKENGNSTQA